MLTLLPSLTRLRCSQISLLENTLLDWHNQTLRNDYRHAQPLHGQAPSAAGLPPARCLLRSPLLSPCRARGRQDVHHVSAELPPGRGLVAP